MCRRKPLRKRAPLDMPVLGMEANPEKAKSRALTMVRKAIKEHGAEVVFLGYAGLAGYAQDIEAGVGCNSPGSHGGRLQTCGGYCRSWPYTQQDPSVCRAGS